MIIAVDVNEARTGIAELLSASWEHVRVEPLATGDFMIGTRIAIERKTTPDFVASLRDGRLFSQASRLLRCVPRPLLLLEGDPLVVDRHLDRGAARGVVLTLMVGFRIPILHTRDLDDTAATIRHLAAQESRRVARRVARRGSPSAVTCRSQAPNPSRGSVEPASDRRVMSLLAALPGVGAVRARSLVTHVGGLAQIASLSVRELIRVPGIGTDTALRIHEVLHAEPAIQHARESPTIGTQPPSRSKPLSDPTRPPGLGESRSS